MDIVAFWIKLYLKSILTKSINYHFYVDNVSDTFSICN